MAPRALHWEQLAIPAGFPTGSLFGRAGRHINEVRAHTGVSRIEIDTVAMTIDIWGPTAGAVEAAVAVYARLFANAAALASFDRVSPTEATVLLGPALEAGACFAPVPPGDEAAAATDKRKQLYTLAPPPPAARLARLAAAQRPAAFDAAAPLPPFALEEAAGGIAAARLERAVHAAMAAQPPYDGIKLRSTLGRQLYSGGGGRGGIASPAALGMLSLADLQELSLGYQKDLQGVFSTGVPVAKVPPMVDRLRELGFERAATKRTLTLHLYERLGFIGHAIAFRRTDDGGLQPAQVRHGKAKLFFAAFVAGDKRPDFRLKLTGTRQHGGGEGQPGGAQEAISRKLMAVAAGCRLEGATIVLPPIHRSTFYVDRVRFIDKEVYRGTLQVDGTAVEVAVKVQSVRDEGGRFHMEVGATCPQLTEQLNRHLAAQPAGGAAAAAGSGGASTAASADEQGGGKESAARSSASGHRAAGAGGKGAATKHAGGGGGTVEEGSLNLSLYIQALTDISRQLLAVC